MYQLINKYIKEKNIQTLLKKPLTKFIEEEWKRSIWYELKLSKNKAKTVPWSKFEEQQLPSLKRIKDSVFPWKISDMDIRRKPCDGWVAYKEETYAALCYYVPRQPKLVYFLAINDVYKLKNTPKKRSIHLDDAIRLAKFIIKV